MTKPYFNVGDEVRLVSECPSFGKLGIDDDWWDNNLGKVFTVTAVIGKRVEVKETNWSFLPIMFELWHKPKAPVAAGDVKAEIDRIWDAVVGVAKGG